LTDFYMNKTPSINLEQDEQLRISPLGGGPMEPHFMFTMKTL